MKRIAIQGIKGCFHEMAAKQYFNNNFEVVECKTFNDLASTLKGNKSDFGIIAIENTLAGSILSNYSLIEKNKFYVMGETYLPIQMHLMGTQESNLSYITEIISHPVALAQCDEYLYALENVDLKEFHDTAAAAKWVAEHQLKNMGAVAGELAAELYGLKILQRNIETHKRNFTRFLIVSRDLKEVEGRNKASLSLELSHQPGSLADILTLFKKFNVNLTKIQSLPIIGKPYQYAFHIDLSWASYDQYSEALTGIKEKGAKVKILGEYVSGSFE